MKIKIESTRYSRYPKSINNHTNKTFYWGRHEFFLDKETDTNAGYRLWKIENGGTVLIKDYFNAGKSWGKTIKDTELFLTLNYTFSINDLAIGQKWELPKNGLYGFITNINYMTRVVTLELGTVEESHLEEIYFGTLMLNWTPSYPRVMYKELNGLLSMID